MDVGLPKGGGSNRLSDTKNNSGMPCLEKTCTCCMWWMESTGIAKELDTKASCDTVKNTIAELSEKAQASDELKKDNEKLNQDKEEYKKTIKELNAKANGIRTVTAVDKPDKGSSPCGRPKGCEPTINRRPKEIDREETVDGMICPDCGDPLSEASSSTLDKVVKMTYVIKQNVLFKRPRRWCRNCGKQKVQPIPEVEKYARRSINHSAATTSLNLQGLSHAKAAAHCKDTMKIDVSRATAYRDKISHSKTQKPRHDEIKEEILQEESLGCDEVHWAVPKEEDNEEIKKGDKKKDKKGDKKKDKKGDKKKDKKGDKKKDKRKNGYGLVALGKKACLVKITDNRRIETLKEFLPNYKGITRHDSYTGWFHIGLNHQMCIAHQIRIIKEIIKYEKPEGDVLIFLQEILRIYQRYYTAHEIDDPHTRRVAARCLDGSMRQLMNHPWKDDGEKTINKFRKRWRREGFFMSTFLYIPGLDPDSNYVERMNRTFASISSDGGGNRSILGMEANSILLTVFATCKLNGTSFYDVLCNASGDG